MKTFEDFFKEENEENNIETPETNLELSNKVLGDEYLYIDINVPTIEDQKYLANYYETSLGLIELIDNVKHVYKVVTEDDDHIVHLFSSENVILMKENAYKYFITSLEEPMLEIKYPHIESVGKINLFRYLDNEVLEANFKSKFKLNVYMKEKLDLEMKIYDNEYVLFEERK